MADDVVLNAGSGGATIAADEIGGVHYQRFKLSVGADGSAIDLSADNPMPISDLNLEVAKGNYTDHTQFEKYGKNLDIDIGTPEDVWGGGGTYTGFPTGAAETMEIFSSSANDTALGTGARTVEISNLQDGSGNAMPNVTVSLAGTAPVSLGAQTYNRCTRLKVMTAGSGGENAGSITLRHTTTTSNIFAVMPAGGNQTAICCYSVPLGYTLYVQHVGMQMARSSGAAGSATMSLRARESGSVFQSKITPEITDGSPYIVNNIYRVFPALTDIKVRCEAVSDNNTIVTADFSGILVAD